MKNVYSRREFIKQMFAGAVAAAAGLSLPSKNVFSDITEKTLGAVEVPDICVLKGKDYRAMLEGGFEAMGGIDRYVKNGSYVVLKPNISWARTPEQAANTHPELVSHVIKMCFKAGADRVEVIDHTCDNYESTFKISGIKEAVLNAGGKIYTLSKDNRFKKVLITNGKRLTEAMISEQVLSADCFINMPIAKDHSAARLTMAMKNYMGIVENRWEFHNKGLHQCIADISSVINPDLIIMDCTRILTSNGPKGPGDVKVLDKIVFGKDHVSVDALGATYFDLGPEDVEYIKIADNMGIGRADLGALKITEKDIT